MKRKDLTVVSFKLLEDKKINHIYFRFKEKILPFIGKEKFAIAVSGGSDSLALSALAKLYSLENDNDFVKLFTFWYKYDVLMIMLCYVMLCYVYVMI
jgi:asparagine synthetase B (glutamine-hydrolysing)